MLQKKKQIRWWRKKQAKSLLIFSPQTKARDALTSYIDFKSNKEMFLRSPTSV